MKNGYQTSIPVVYPPGINMKFRKQKMEKRNNTALVAGNNQTCTNCTPAGRISSTTWADGLDLYLFGGGVERMSPLQYLFSQDNFFVVSQSQYVATTAQPIYNDVWRYHIPTNEWFFMGGDIGPLYQNSSNLPTHSPFPLSSPASYYDPNDRVLYLYGGISNSNNLFVLAFCKLIYFR
jgi:hypothetical protein